MSWASANLANMPAVRELRIASGGPFQRTVAKIAAVSNGEFCNRKHRAWLVMGLRAPDISFDLGSDLLKIKAAWQEPLSTFATLPA